MRGHVRTLLLGDVLFEGRAVDAERLQLLVQDLCRHALEEQVDRDDDHHQVVEAAEDRDVVRDDVAPEDQIAERTREEGLPARGRSFVPDELPHQAGVEGRAACDRQERQEAKRAAYRAARSSPNQCARMLRCHLVRLHASPATERRVYQRAR